MNKPFKLKPVFKDYVWGGDRIINELHKEDGPSPCAEAWEFSCHPNGVSYCDSGEFKGRQIKEIFKLHPEYLGKYSNPNGDIPILIKYIDAKEDLSIQVHPNDKYALEKENSLGKTEVWYILNSNNGHLSVGFKEDVNKEIVSDALKNETICDLVNNFSVKKGEYYPIESGTIHAINSGCLLIEVQENSDLTYRLYDYNRVDKNNNKRPLHIDKALDVLNFKKYIKPNQKLINYSCKYFSMNTINTPTSISVNNDSFCVLMCIEGECFIQVEDENLKLKYGDSLFVPSNSNFNVDGQAKLLKISV